MFFLARNFWDTLRLRNRKSKSFFYGLILFVCRKFSIFFFFFLWTFFIFLSQFFVFFFFFFLKKIKFLGDSFNFYYFWKKIRSRYHLPYFSNLFLKNMSKFRVNNLFWIVLTFYSQVQKNDFTTLLLQSLLIFSIEKFLMSICIEVA